MVFSSIVFLFYYLPACLLIYRLAPLGLRNLVLLVFSLAFYGWGEPVYVFLMAGTILADYLFGLLIARCPAGSRKAKLLLTCGVVTNLGLLFFFKYYDFLAANVGALLGVAAKPLGVTLPIGISFYSFQAMSYLVDVYRADAQVQKNPVDFGAYIAMFPQLIAGPIVSYKTVAQQLRRRDQGVEKFASGVLRFTVGLCKKVLLANSIGRLWTEVSASGALSMAGAWIGLAAFGFQIYFDFSGYSDMAIGLGRMFGFEFLENFDHPYESSSVSEFWRRWHISLTNWFRDYVYIPLGGNRKGAGRTAVNLAAVWLLTGIWHGASWNFLLWGLYFLVFILLERFVLQDLLARLPRPLRHVYTLAVVFFGWCLFALEDLGQLGEYLRALFGGAGLYHESAGYWLRSYGPLLLILAAASTSLGKRLWQKMPGRRVLEPALLLAGLVLSTACLVDATYNPFLYFRF